jgi:hypothetical protein
MEDGRETKRRRMGAALDSTQLDTPSDHAAVVALTEEDNVLQAGGHPYGVEPTGNRYLRGSNSEGIGSGSDPGAECRSAGLGPMQVLDDDLLLTVLGCLSAVELGRFVQVSRGTLLLFRWKLL